MHLGKIIFYLIAAVVRYGQLWHSQWRLRRWKIRSKSEGLMDVFERQLVQNKSRKARAAHPLGLCQLKIALLSQHQYFKMWEIKTQKDSLSLQSSPTLWLLDLQTLRRRVSNWRRLESKLCFILPIKIQYRMMLEEIVTVFCLKLCAKNKNSLRSWEYQNGDLNLHLIERVLEFLYFHLKTAFGTLCLQMRGCIFWKIS